MRGNLVPGSFWRHPARWTTMFDDMDDVVSNLTTMSSGLQVSEDDKHVYIEAAVPGIDPQDIEVTYDKGTVWIKGEAKVEEQDKNKKYYRRAAQSFSYRVVVPGRIDEQSEPEATAKHGVMKITFTKVAEEQPKKIAIKNG